MDNDNVDNEGGLWPTLTDNFRTISPVTQFLLSILVCLSAKIVLNVQFRTFLILLDRVNECIQLLLYVQQPEVCNKLPQKFWAFQLYLISLFIKPAAFTEQTNFCLIWPGKMTSG